MRSFLHWSSSQKKSVSLQVQKKRIDKPLLFTVVFTCLFGLIFIFEASSVAATRDFGDPYRYLRDQSLWLVLGLGVMFSLSFFDYHRLHQLALPLIIITVLLLLLVFIPGIGVKVLGARRWLDLRFLIVQPAEVAKLTLAVYLSAWFSHPEKGRLPAFLLLLGLVVGLVIAEPDLGTAVVIGSVAFILYFLSGAPLKHFLILLPGAFVAVLGLAVASPYRFRRLLTFLKPDVDPLGASYHIRQILLALGTGGLWGQGLGKSRQKFEYLPEATTDSIFAIIGEELGFIGTIFVVSLFLFIVYRGLKIALFAPDRFGQLLALGICSWVAIQALINLGAMVALLPLTGVPLPLISYGGSSLVVTLAGVGILLNISKQRLAQTA